jgi:hypothetical protein
MLRAIGLLLHFDRRAYSRVSRRISLETEARCGNCVTSVTDIWSIVFNVIRFSPSQRNNGARRKRPAYNLGAPWWKGFFRLKREYQIFFTGLCDSNVRSQTVFENLLDRCTIG